MPSTPDETIGELVDRLPPGVWVELPEYGPGVRAKRYAGNGLTDDDAYCTVCGRMFSGGLIVGHLLRGHGG